MFPLPTELVFKIMSYLSLEDNEQFTLAFPEYYDEIKEKKREFIERNYFGNYRPVIRIGINKTVDTNLECVKQLTTFRKCIIGKFPPLFSELFVSDKTHIIECQKRFRTRNGLKCKSDWLQGDSYMGKHWHSTVSGSQECYPFLILRRADNREFITLWRTGYKTWSCTIDDHVTLILKPSYADFRTLDYIAELITQT